MALWLLLLFVGGSQALSYYGTEMTYYPKNSGINGSYTVELRYKVTTGACETGSYTWDCLSGDCGTEIGQTTDIVDKDSEVGTFCQTETKRTLQLPSNAPFQLSMNWSRETWSSALNDHPFIKALSLVDLRTRSDTGQANRPPQATIMSPLQIPSNCLRTFSPMTYDPDGDLVVCTYATKYLEECDPCTPPPDFDNFLPCSLSFNPSNSTREGLYAVELMMGDYHRSDLNLTQSNGNKELRLAHNGQPFSRLPFQFALILMPAVPSCAPGQYLPLFVSPTPEHEAKLNFTVGVQQHIVIQANATEATVSGLLFSGPSNITKTSNGDGQFNLTWTPTEDDDGETFPLCFVAKGLFNSIEYHSDVRCVLLVVGNVTFPPEPAPMVNLSGVALTYYHNSTRKDGSTLGTLRSKLNFDTCSESALFYCWSDGCGNQNFESYVVDKENSGEFCQIETIYELSFPADVPFEMYLDPWSENLPFPGYFVDIDFRTRSDTGRSNSPPMTTVPPVLRIPQNCPRDYKILAFDDEGDLVKLCDYYDSDSCLPCSNTSGPGTSEFCVRSYDPTFFHNFIGPYPLYGSLKDFPRQNITLTQTSGSLEEKTPNDAISQLSFEINLNFDSSVPSCTEGVYLPKFVPPTPEYGLILNASAGQTLNISIKAEANTSTVSELLFSAPHEMNETTTGEGEFTLTWTPSEAEKGQSHPVCFVVQAVLGSSKYQTEMRCVAVRVDPLITVPPSTKKPNTDYPPTTVPPTAENSNTDYNIVVGNARLFSSTPLTDADIKLILQQLKTLLIQLGLPSDTVMEQL